VSIIEQIENTRKEYEAEAIETFVGRTITDVHYQTDAELEDMGWSSRALVFTFDDGGELVLSSDPEGNGPGSGFYFNGKGGRSQVFCSFWKPELREDAEAARLADFDAKNNR
jgi:hypothetical protein